MTTQLPRVTKGPSIYDFIHDRLDPAGRLDDSGIALPDEDRVMPGSVRWAAGAMDGVTGHHAGGDGSSERASAAARVIARACRRPTRRRLLRVYETLSEDGVLDYLDGMIEQLAELQPPRDVVHDVGRWLATTAVDRGAVKVGLALLGVTGLDRDIDVVRTLGAHDEFTLYAAVALRNGLDDPESELWALASAVDGWGRIECVDRLRGTTDPAIRSWLLRGGFRNSIMYEYLAYVAATTGGMLEALRADHPDRELLTACGEIIQALIAGGPAEDMDDYDEGADAVEAYLGHMAARAETLDDFHAVAAIASYLERAEWSDEDAHRGWTATRRTAFEARCREILSRPEWDGRVAVALASDDPAEFWRADRAARIRGLDTFDLHVQRIKDDPLGSSWFEAWKQADSARASLLAALASDLLPLSDIATGPAREIGLGPGWGPHGALDWTLQALRDHPGVGGELVITGLHSPVTRNRNMALNALKAWPAELWPGGARQLVEELARADPDDGARDNAAEALGARQE